MNIAFLVHSFPSVSQTFIINQITGLIGLGHEVDIFALDNSDAKIVHNDVRKFRLFGKVNYFYVPQGRAKRILKAFEILFRHLYSKEIWKCFGYARYWGRQHALDTVFKLAPFLKKKYDVIHCHFGPNGLLGSAFRRVGLNAKFVVTFYGYDMSSFIAKNGRNIYKSLFTDIDLLLVICDYFKDKLVNLGCDARKIKLHPLGIDLEKFRFFERRIEPGECVRLLTIGRLVEKKGLEYAITAISRVAMKHNNIEYFIAGDGPLKADLEALAKELGVERHVRFLGSVRHEEAAGLYKQAHIFVLPSITASNGDKEGTPTVLLEAQASGLPVISTYHSGIPEIVVDGKTGFLVPERDSVALAGKIIYLIEHPEIWAEMGKSGRKFVENNYDIRSLNKQLVEIYEEVLNN
ncbi:MAG: glycosyltransferase [Candidatus Omnitrophica bacterium]|nr:glycosyltransferase [Candidatus Omnitrophota bacterium]